MAIKFIRIDDWTALAGATAVIKIHGTPVCTGTVDTVTEDGKILWLQPKADSRRLFEKTPACQAWVNDDNPGLNYRIKKQSHEHRRVPTSHNDVRADFLVSWHAQQVPRIRISGRGIRWLSVSSRRPYEDRRWINKNSSLLCGIRKEGGVAKDAAFLGRRGQSAMVSICITCMRTRIEVSCVAGG